MPRSRFLQYSLAVVLSSFSAACSFEVGLGPWPESGCSASCYGFGPIPPAIRITPDGEIGLAVGDSVPLAATYTENAVQVSGVTFQWQSSAPTVAEVSESGTVRAVAVGSALIVLTVRAISDTVTVHVRPPG